MKRAFLLPALVMLLGTPASAADTPKLDVLWASWLPTPLPPSYDEKADAPQAVADAFARARTSGKHVLLDFGGNWCPACRILSALPAMKSFMEKHFEIVSIDIGHSDRNLDIAENYGAKIQAVPFLVITRPDGKILVRSDAVADKNHTRPQQMANWIAFWAE